MPILGTPTQVTGGSGTYAPESGSSRIVVLCVARATTDNASDITPTLTAFTWGTPSLANGQIHVAKEVGIGNAANYRAFIGYVLEADLPGSAQTPTITWSDAMTGSDLIMCFTLGGMNQVAPLDGTGASQASSTGVDPWTGSLTIAANCIQILTHGIRGGGNSSTPGTGWTEVQDTSNGTLRAITQYATSQPAGSLAYSSDLSAGATTGALVAASFAEASTNWTQHHQHPAHRSPLIRM